MLALNQQIRVKAFKVCTHICESEDENVSLKQQHEECNEKLKKMQNSDKT